MPWRFVFRAGGTDPPHPSFGEADEKLLVRESVSFAGGLKLLLTPPGSSHPEARSGIGSCEG